MAYRYRFDLHTDGLQCVLLWPDLRVRAWSGAARGARDGERDTAVRAEPGRAGPRPAAVRHGVGNAEANCRRRARALCPLWRGLAGPDSCFLLMAREFVAQCRIEIGVQPRHGVACLNGRAPGDRCYPG